MATFSGGLGRQILKGINNERNDIYGEDFAILGTGGNDRNVGGANAQNFLHGEGRFVGINGSITSGGNDVIVGGRGFTAENYMYGDAFSAQSITGGNDRLVSGKFATDHMYGDWDIEGPFDSIEGNDVFVFGPNSGNDFIYDFQRGLDRIELKASPGVSLPLSISEIAGDSIVQIDAENSITVVGVLGLSDSDFVDDFAPDNTGTAGQLGVGAHIEGMIEQTNDKDWFAIELEVDQTYQIDVSGIDGFDPSIRLLASDGSLVARDNNGGPGRDSRITFTASEDGTHFVAVNEAGLNDVGSYRVTIELDDHFEPDNINTNGAVTVDGSTSGRIEIPNDNDWFAVDLEADQTYQIDVAGIDGFDPSIRLFGPDRQIVDRDNNGGPGRDAQITVTTSEDGTYFVAVNEAGRNDIGDYEVSVQTLESGASSLNLSDMLSDREFLPLADNAVLSGSFDTTSVIIAGDVIA